MTEIQITEKFLRTTEDAAQLLAAVAKIMTEHAEQKKEAGYRANPQEIQVVEDVAAELRSFLDSDDAQRVRTEENRTQLRPAKASRPPTEKINTESLIFLRRAFSDLTEPLY